MQAGSAPLVAPHVLTDDSVPGLFSFSFSPRARYYVLNYSTSSLVPVLTDLRQTDLVFHGSAWWT